MTTEDLRMLKERLSAEWFIKKTDVFNPEVGDESTTCAQAFREYWNLWVRDDVKALFEMVEENKRLKDQISSLQLEVSDMVIEEKEAAERRDYMNESDN